MATVAYSKKRAYIAMDGFIQGRFKQLPFDTQRHVTMWYNRFSGGDVEHYPHVVETFFKHAAPALKETLSKAQYALVQDDMSMIATHSKWVMHVCRV